MSTYKYTAKNKDGQTVIGFLEGATDAEVAETLHQRELIVVGIEQMKQKTAKQFAGRDQRVKLDDIVVFSRQLATMVDAGIPLVHALSILSEQMENKKLKDVIATLRRDIEAGMGFSEAIAKHPVVFSELFISMAKAGETSGMLDEVLDRLAGYLEKSAALSRKIRSSLIYPAVVISMALLITAVLLLKVVPTFKGIFASLGGTLPLPTQILISISDAFQRHFLYIVGGLVLVIVLISRYISTQKGRYNFDAFKLKVPILGTLFRKVAVAKFARTFSTLVKSGVSVLSSLEIVSKSSGNKLIEEAVVNSTKSVREGEPISKPLAKSGVFPPMVTRMIAVGEQTGQLEKMLSKIADFYDEQVDAAAAGLTSMIEPLVIAFLGIVIGGIVISLFLPIFKITQLIAK